MRDRKIQIVTEMGGCCSDCGGVFDPVVYDFHHVSGDKEINPSAALRRSLDKAMEEISKCVLLCANCHRLRHFKEVDGHESID